MHLGLDLLFLVPAETGGREAYSRELLAALRAAEPGLRVTTFLNRETAQAPGWWSDAADRAVVLPRVWARRPAGWALGEAVSLGRAAAAARVEVLHSPANFGTAWGPFARVVTLHDLMYRGSPGLVTRATRLGTDAVLVPAARRAHRLITATEVSRAEIADGLGIAPTRISVVRHGVHPPPERTARPVDTGGRRLVLAVGTNVPHKNHEALLAGLARREQRPLLAIAGHGTEALAPRAAELGVSDDVRLYGAVDADTLEDLYAAADTFITATRHEGFGLPVIEAMSRGVPVAASDIPVLREVAGELATWFDPHDPDAVAAALGPLPDRAAAGRARAARYTWPATAEATLEVYAQALAAKASGLTT
ncbi:glycosyltransferase family 4 protein [Candidatus Solirubrobacter pratensis]|uniref:glycosyltransferase family 4 protein n=1 Tax=Candidatus Solirubrobacter pratensis TaxID=1298857 RepID=UPI0003F95D9F|nr:glycosyltransferase family 1 protein [Candidatus Solirubrobacter pratensis]